MKFKQETLAERVLIKPFIETMSKGGIAIARDERSQAINTDSGVVVLVGPACWWDMPVEFRPNLQPGDKVKYAKWGAKVMKDEDTGEYYILCNDKDILVGYEND